ncbi:unnamed protein product [Callosobruchus maculatus]|nr:unnamed protein product [Callosobruchus maculatus]
MKDRSSIIAIDEENDEIAGVLILKAVKKCDYGRVFSRIMLSDGLVYQSVKEFMNYITRKVDIYEHFQCEIFLRYYLLCITPPYRGKGLGYHMMQTGVDIARHLNIPVIMGLMTNWKLQKLARKLGMETVFEIEYKTWHDKTGELVFCNLGAGNYSCALMAGELPPPPPPPPPPKKESNTKKEKVTRGEKRKAVQKQKG